MVVNALIFRRFLATLEKTAQFNVSIIRKTIKKKKLLLSVEAAKKWLTLLNGCLQKGAYPLFITLQLPIPISR